MKTNHYLTTKYRNKLISDVKDEIKDINSEIDSKLLSLQDDYKLIIEKANNLYDELCTLYNNLSSKNFTFENNNETLNNFNTINTITTELYSLKENDLIENLLTNKLKKMLIDDFGKIKCIQFNLKKIDNKACMLAVNVSLANIFKKVNDYCEDILNDFSNNYERKISDLILNIIDTISDVNSSEIIVGEQEDTPQNKNTFIPKEYRNKKFTFKELAKIAEKNNYVYCRDKGDHQIFKHTSSGKIVVIPYKSNATAPIGTQQSILNMIFSNNERPFLVS